jgi:hypothetical protein
VKLDKRVDPDNIISSCKHCKSQLRYVPEMNGWRHTRKISLVFCLAQPGTPRLTIEQSLIEHSRRSTDVHPATTPE